MRFASSITTAPNAQRATEELLEPIDGRVTPGMVDLVMLFSTSDFNDDLRDVVDRIQSAFPAAILLGCTAAGTIGCDQEQEVGPSMSLLAASMPDVQIRPFQVTQQDLDSINSECDWERIVAVSAESNPTFLALGDPFGVAVDEFVELLSEGYPGAPLIGGLASAAREPRKNRLILDGRLHREGIIGVTMTGRLTVDTVVSQGCRPIGKPFVITQGERNVIRELGGRPALQQLQSVLSSLSPTDAKLARQLLFLGRVIDEYKDRFGRGDFLIQSIIGADRDSGAIGIMGHARVGATVQFHVRDAASADEDLRAMLKPHAGTDVRGAMLFGCNGRGTNMWPESGHDVGVFRELLGDVPVAGCFCGGEFGTVGGRNFIHGFTASIGLFKDPNPT